MFDYLKFGYRWLTLIASVICFATYSVQNKYIKQRYGLSTLWPKGLISPKKSTRAEKLSLVKVNYGILTSAISFFIYTFIPVMENLL